MVVAFVRTHQWDNATNRLRGIYQKALYESSGLTEGMAVNFNKVSVAGGPARELLLADVIRQAQGVQADLAVLPLSSSAIAPAMKYINQAGDFCQRLLTRLGEGDSLSSEDAANLTSLFRNRGPAFPGAERHHSGIRGRAVAPDGSADSIGCAFCPGESQPAVNPTCSTTAPSPTAPPAANSRRWRAWTKFPPRRRSSFCEITWGRTG